MIENVFCIGNGESRIDFDLTQLRKYGKIYGCNALYRDFKPDVLTAVDQGISHEIYQSGYAKDNECWFRSWTKVPKIMYEHVVEAQIPEQDKKELSEVFNITENKEQKENAEEFVFHGSNLQGVVNVLRQKQKKGLTKEVIQKEINHTGVYVSWCYKNDKSHTLDEVWEKDRGWACGATSGYLACHKESPLRLFMLGHDLNSTTHKLNNVYKDTKYYGLSDASPIPSVNWINQWKQLFVEFPNVKFYKVNKYGIKGNNFVDREIDDWAGIQNLMYIDYPKMLDILGDL